MGHQRKRSKTEEEESFLLRKFLEEKISQREKLI